MHIKAPLTPVDKTHSSQVSQDFVSFSTYHRNNIWVSSPLVCCIEETKINVCCLYVSKHIAYLVCRLVTSPHSPILVSLSKSLNFNDCPDNSCSNAFVLPLSSLCSFVLTLLLAFQANFNPLICKAMSISSADSSHEILLSHVMRFSDLLKK